MILSIIIPVFKVEAYIEQCLLSIVGFNGDYEVILVNDGTPDESMIIAASIVRGLDNVRIVNQSNQGLSAARMAGLKEASGKYVWFVDSDDYLLPGGMERVLSILEEDVETDLFIFPALWVYEDGCKNQVDMSLDKEVMAQGKALLKEDKYPKWLVQRFIIRKSLFDKKGLFFPPGKLHEDVYFCPVVGYLSSMAKILPSPVYAYRIRPGSIMTTRGVRSSYDLLSIYRQLKDFWCESVLPADRPWFNSILAYALRESFRVSRFLFGTEEFRRFHSENKQFVLSEYGSISSGLTLPRKITDHLLFKYPKLFQFIVQRRDTWK